jgi:predicted nucleotidyltransferase component of viral defense system
LIVDVNFNERPYLPTELGRLDLPYSDLAGPERRIQVVSLSEILGNKWFMVGDDERNEPRDLFDLWAGLSRFGVRFDEVAFGHRAKYGWRPQAHQLARADRLRAAWDVRLSHQIRDLPPFDQVLADVREAFDNWQARELSERPR